jgi:hypothetical protein
VSFTDYQKKVRDVCLARAASADDLAALGHEAWRWEAYRRMVRTRFHETIDHCYGRLIEAIGLARFHALTDRFFAESPPRSPYLRDVPGEFLAFLERSPGSLATAERLPPYAVDLARFEWAELDTAYTSEERRAAPVAPFDMNLPAVLTPAHRVLRLTYAVNRAGDVPGWEGLTPSPLSLCLYREPSTHDVTTLELLPIEAALLEEMSRADRPLAAVVRDVAAREGATLDVPFVDALSTFLANLIERGVVLGSRAERA